MSKVIIGGKQRVIGGWGDYEITSRGLRKDRKADYKDRTYINQDDVVESVTNKHSSKTLRQAASLLADRMEKYESSVSDIQDYFVMPALSSSDLRDFDGLDNLEEIGNAVLQVSAVFGKPLASIPSLSASSSMSSSMSSSNQVILVSDEEAVIKLEESSRQRIKNIEEMQAIVADRMNKCYIPSS
jgi:hypothetical protein